MPSVNSSFPTKETQNNDNTGYVIRQCARHFHKQFAGSMLLVLTPEVGTAFPSS